MSRTPTPRRRGPFGRRLSTVDFAKTLFLSWPHYGEGKKIERRDGIRAIDRIRIRTVPALIRMAEKPMPAVYEGEELEALAIGHRYQEWIAEQFRPYLRGTV